MSLSGLFIFTALSLNAFASPSPLSKIKSGFVYIKDTSSCGYRATSNLEDNALVLTRTLHPLNTKTFSCYYEKDLSGTYSCNGSQCISLDSSNIVGYIVHKHIEITADGNFTTGYLLSNGNTSGGTIVGEIINWVATQFEKGNIPTLFSLTKKVKCPVSNEDRKHVKNQLLSEGLKKCSLYYNKCKLVPNSFDVMVAHDSSMCHVFLEVSGANPLFLEANYIQKH